MIEEGKESPLLRVLVADATSSAGAAIVEHLRADGARVACGDAGEPRAVVEAAVEELGGLDGMVVACGEAAEQPLSKTSDATWDAMLDSHLLEPWRFAVAARDALVEARGAIVFIASAAADWPSLRRGAHSVGAHGLVALARMLAVELGEAGVRVNALCPEDSTDSVAAPLDTVEAGADLARAVAFFLSPDARGHTANAFLIDGGRRATLTAGAAVAT